VTSEERAEREVLRLFFLTVPAAADLELGTDQ